MIDEAQLRGIMWASTSETFETMIMLPLEEVGIPDQWPDPSMSLASSITFTGQFQGAFSAIFSMDTAEKIARAMLMMEPEEEIDEPGICDACGEVVNMLIGGTKAKLIDTAPDIQISIPTVTKGRNIYPVKGKGMTTVLLATKVDGDPMNLAIAYKSDG